MSLPKLSQAFFFISYFLYSDVCLLYAGESIKAASVVLPHLETDHFELGKKIFLQCSSCHSFDINGSHGVGPNLNNVFGSIAGTKPDFPYSSAMQDSSVTWTDETLDKYIKSPLEFMPGNAMSFGGIPLAENRINLLEYLRIVTSHQE